MPSADSRRWFRPADLLIPAVVVPLLLLFGRGEHGGGASFLIHRPDGSGDALDLQRDTVVTVQGNLGPLLVEVREGAVRIVASPCAGQDCVRHPAVDSPGDPIVCIPSGVYVTICGASPEESPDAWSY